MFFEWLRRNQNIIAPAGLFLFSIVLLSFSSHTRYRNVSAFSRLIMTTASYGQRSVAYTASAAVRLWERYVWLVGVEQENLRYRREILDLQRKNYQLLEQEIENERLRKLLGFRPREDIEGWIPAQVIGDDLSGINKTVTIDKGTLHGIKPRMAVIAYDSALVGQILDEPGSAIGFTSSQVLLITDRRSRVTVMVQRSRDKGSLAGRLEGDECEMIPDKRLADVKVGDLLISSGYGGVFMKGWPVGRVTEIVRDPEMFYPRIRVEPIADFSKLEEVIVVLPVRESP